ncbi:sensor histidine kinase [Acidicapsa ligni]|uniref:sensor histidine kinase n=1 Tax=Acidicapsa ligni TaxID=542300 RepID=UPI0021E09254|nr:ATP-binding protein [Acidicapsa ligni]
MLRRTIDATIHQDLQERVDDVRIEIQHLGPHFTLDKAQEHFESVYRDRDEGKWLQIRDQNGQWIYRSSRMAYFNVPLSFTHDHPATGDLSEFILGGHPVRALSIALFINDQRYTVETGISMNKPRILLHNFGICLLLLTPIVVVVAAAGGHLMSRKALAPVNRIAQEARRISDKNLDTRLPVSTTKDELSFLSITLNNMLARIDAGFRSVKDFTANASHELRTPLARIRTEAEIALLRPREVGEYREILEHMHQSSIEMSVLVDNLLTLARAEAGTEIFRLTPIDLQVIIAEIAQEWRPITERLSINLYTNFQHSTTNQEAVFVLGDRLSLLRILRIWLDNSCKFTAANGSITIEAVMNVSSATLAVIDDGIGIAPEHQKHIFNRFYRVKGDTSEQSVGAGLGLTLAEWIADQHKTHIIVDSVPGHGSRFQMCLPRVGNEVSALKPAVLDMIKSLPKSLTL